MSEDYLAKEAQRLLADDALKQFFDLVRREAQEALVVADADNKIEIVRLQQRVVAIDAIRAELTGATLRRANKATSAGTVA